MSGLLDVLGARLPGLFARGMELLEAKADAGNAAARSRLEDVRSARSAMHIAVEGDGDLFIGVADGQLTASETAPEGVPVRLSLGVPADAMQAAFSRWAAEAEPADDRVAKAVTRGASKRVEGVIEGKRLDFHVILEGVPELERVVVKVAVGAAEPPAAPGFTATVRYGDIEAARETGLDPTQFFMGGRVRFTGDYVPALQLGMQIAQALQSARPR